MRWLIYISSVFLLLTIALSCVNNQKSLAAKENNENMKQLSVNITGLYSGDLPCVDCEAINTMLELNQDKSYVLRYIYEGKSDDQFVKKGEWSIDKNTLSLEGVDYQYKVNPDYLLQLDLYGNEIKGDLAEKYQLSRVK